MTPRDDSSPGDSHAISKIFLSGLGDGLSDDELYEYFGQFGEVVQVEQLLDKSTGRKRGIGYVEFDDYDSVDKLMLLKGFNHIVNGFKIDVKKFMTKSEMMKRDHEGSARQLVQPRTEVDILGM